MNDPQDIFNNPVNYWGFITASTDAAFEGQHFDRKQAGYQDNEGKASSSSIDTLQEEIIECVSAFANNDGGLIIVGISKIGEITGINHLNEDQLKRISSINQLLRNQAAQTKYVDSTNTAGNQDRLLFIYVPRTDSICETIKSPAKAWIRNGSICEPLTDEMRESIKRDKRIIDFEKMTCCEFDAGDIDQSVLEQFRKSYANENNHLANDQDFLYQIGAVSKDKGGYFFTKAGYLFFARSPQRMLPWAHVRLMRFDVPFREYRNRRLPNFDRQFDGPLPQQIRKLRVYFKESGFFKNYQRRAASGGFIDEPELPPIAVDEAIVNAIAHRDYGIQIPIECALYNDGFIVENPGRIIQRDRTVPSQFDLNEVTLDSMPRNSTLINWLKSMRDDEGKAFVQALSEGTKRMQEEMLHLELPAPQYQTNFMRTFVTLISNAEEREARYKAITHTTASTEFTNLYQVNIITSQGSSESPLIFIGKINELNQFLSDSLESKGWFIDRQNFGQIIAHRKGAPLLLPESVKAEIQFFPAYNLQFKIFGNMLFLCIDYTLEVKNLSNCRSLLNILSSQDINGRFAIARMPNWQRVRIIRADIETTLVRSEKSGQEEIVGSDKVVPDLPIVLIEKNIRSKNIRFDLFKEIKRSSLALEPNSSRIRADKSTSTAGELATSIFPLLINGLTLTLEKKPFFLGRDNDGVLTIRSLPEPAVEFNRHRESPDIRDGITKFGSYESDPKNLEIIPVCLAGMQSAMAGLIARLKTGKYKYSGSEKTFSTRLSYNAIIPVNTPELIKGECERLLSEHNEWIGDPSLNRLFLVQTPEEGYSLDDEKSPYFQVKRLLLENGIPCQMVDTPTLQNPDWKDLNLSLNLIAKCGVTPWVLPNSIPEADFFVGLSYTQSHSKGLRRLLGYATVFNNFGRWEFYSGNTDAFSYEEREQFFAQLTEHTLKQLDKSSSLSDRPNIYFHYSAKFSKDDIATIVKAARKVRPMGTYHFVSINSHHNIRLYDNRPETDGSLSRGSYVVLSPKHMIISTTGYNPYRKALGTPKPLEVRIWIEPPTGEKIIQPDLKALATQILSLTKLNWASTDSLCGEPITVKYAGDIAYLTDAFLRQSESFNLHKVLEKTPWFI